MNQTKEITETLQRLLGKEVEQDLSEMATVCSRKDGFGNITIRIYSDDHNPPHAHVFDKDMRLVGKFLIDRSKPNRASDIEAYQASSYGNIPDIIRTEVVKWASSYKRGVENWKGTMFMWDSLHTQ